MQTVVGRRLLGVSKEVGILVLDKGLVGVLDTEYEGQRYDEVWVDLHHDRLRFGARATQ